MTNLSFKKASKAMYAARQRTFPKTPTNVTEINEAFEKNEHIQETYGMTKRIDEEMKTKFFKGAIEDKNYAACIFASDDIVKSILATSKSDERLLYADATFSITPIGIFKQVLVVFASIYTYVSYFLKNFFFEQLTNIFQSLFLFLVYLSLSSLGGTIRLGTNVQQTRGNVYGCVPIHP